MRLVFLLASVTAVIAAGADDNGYANSFSYGNGQGFGYSGSFGPGGAGGAAGGAAGGVPPVNFGSGGSPPPNFPPFNFNNLFSQYFDLFQKFNQELATVLQNQHNAIAAGVQGASSGVNGGGVSGGGVGGGFSSVGGQGGAAGASVGPGGTYQTGSVFPENPNVANAINGFGGGFSSVGGQGAAASASIGPGGAHQTASVFPENPKVPNVNNRFGSSSPDGSFYGIFTSSQSYSSNADGKTKSYQKATTTINDNGNVTTYTVHNP
ncbi:hypothetical protein ILUMI_21167 [Ignelater luminosus]|uniref:Uncharacterized protein n=1 Tax=Ignelater luminosus TaxID=2038154 RepID=A0A8K0CCX8_IGNLU|nr:hypothetical protein ILUMI_21167 [Ignelater luminosus]